MASFDEFNRKIAADVCKEEPSIKRIVTGSAHGQTAAKYLNSIIKSGKRAYFTGLALATYPAQVWAIQCELGASGMTGKLREAVDKVLNIQGGLTMLGETPRTLSMSAYTRSKENTLAIVQTIRDATEGLLAYPDVTMANGMYRVINCLHTGMVGESEDVSAFMLKQYYPLAVCSIARLCEDKLSELFASMTEDYDENAYYYHDTEALLDVYRRLVWHHGLTQNQLKKILSAESVDDLSKLNISDSLAFDTYNIIEFIKIINVCIEKVRAYPAGGNDLALALETYLEPETDMAIKTATSPHERICSVFGVGTTKGRAIYRKAVFVLSTALWGYSTRDILNGIVIR